MIAVSFWASWAIIGLAVAGIILFYCVLNVTIDAGRAFLADAAQVGEDLTANRERER